MQTLDIRDISIIDSFPVLNASKPTILTVGCGEGRIERFIAKTLGYKVIATDVRKFPKYEEIEEVLFKTMDIFKPNLGYKSDVVICAQVLEHLAGWKSAFSNLIELSSVRVIVTVPYKSSFHSLDHINFWNDATIREFIHLAYPFSTAISKIRTKPEDAPNKGCFLIVVDKKQHYGI
jgi:SAM-dependent methyltransferase